MSSLDPIPDRDGPRDECGVFGLYAPESDVARLAYLALHALQHRGQESAGIATAEGGHVMTMRDLGLVFQVFDEQKLQALQGDIALGHVRYSTTGSGAWENAQPVWRSDRRQVALAHNGNLINAVELHSELLDRGVTFRGTSDSEIIAALISTHEAERVEDALADVVPRLEGAFSTVIMTGDRVIAFRDPAGLRPLSLGRLAEPPGQTAGSAGRAGERLGQAAGSAGRAGERFCVASESCAFDIIGAELPREVQPGEMVSLSEGGIETRQLVESERQAFCVFEHIYFARPDSMLEGNRTQVSRRKMGEILWREAPVEADVVVAVPDSGTPAATGYSKASGLPRDEGLIKNRYVARTFIQPGQELRKHGLRMKFNPLREVVEGKRLVVVDDSIVRGNTTRQIIGMLREAGAAEVHMRISAPPIRHPCHYGIDMSTVEEMVAHGRTVEEIATELGCDTLAYLSLDGVYEAIRGSRETHCDACFSGDYPLERTDAANGKFALEELAVITP
ncbi:MAG: amidophosphoribosyltransferase [Actinomycetota bacterium]|nr:amidophosphoribosyltransferase [Actinomycetota bacterium]